MKQILIIPDRNHLQECLELAKKYQLGFEYNDFFMPDVLDDEILQQGIIQEYQQKEGVSYSTLHGAFFDVIPFSMDKKIQQISNLRIKQSIEVARKVGAKAVIFHTNYNPFLNTKEYIKSWIKINEIYWSGILEENPDINIYLENMFDISPDILLELSERLSRYNNFGVCLDWAHAALTDVEPEIWAEKLGKYIKHVHINDNDGVGDLHLAWGDGSIKREVFYECYEKYLKGATILIETSPMENKIRSLEILKKEGFF